MRVHVAPAAQPKFSAVATLQWTERSGCALSSPEHRFGTACWSERGPCESVASRSKPGKVQTRRPRVRAPAPGVLAAEGVTASSASLCAAWRSQCGECTQHESSTASAMPEAPPTPTARSLQLRIVAGGGGAASSPGHEASTQQPPEGPSRLCCPLDKTPLRCATTR